MKLTFKLTSYNFLNLKHFFYLINKTLYNNENKFLIKNLFSKKIIQRRSLLTSPNADKASGQETVELISYSYLFSINMENIRQFKKLMNISPKNIEIAICSS